MAHRHVLAPRMADLGQTGVAGKAEDVAAALLFQEFHDLRRAVMPIAEHGDLHPGPVVPDAADDVLENLGRLFYGGPFARAQKRENRLARGCLEDVDGLEAIVVIMSVEQRQLLAAVDGIAGIVDIENDALRHPLEAGENRSIRESPMRASSRHDGAFSSRDSVGWDIKSSPVSARRPQAILNAGSKRSTSRSSQSS